MGHQGQLPKIGLVSQAHSVFSLEKLSVKVERMVLEGKAIARTQSGKIVLVDYGVPGDTLKVRVDSKRPGHITAHPVEIIKSGADRITPRCPYHFSTLHEQPNYYCGGCDWQHIAASAQLEQKRQIVIDALNRIGGFKTVHVLPTSASPKTWRYRNKVQVPFRKGTRGLIQAGFYVPGSHQVVDFDDCLVQPEVSVKIVRKVKELCYEFGLEPYDEQRQSGWLRHLLIRINKTGEAMISFITRVPHFPRHKEVVERLAKSFPGIIGIHQNVQPRDTSVILGREWKKIWGADFIMESIGNLSLRLSPGSFFQVNHGACEILYDAVKQYVFAGSKNPFKVNSPSFPNALIGNPGVVNKRTGFPLTTRGNDEPKILDVYSGVGALALWLAYGNKNVNTVTGLEESPQAVSDACWNAANLNINNARFIRGKAEKTLPSVLHQVYNQKGAAIAVLDPPRSGCEEKVLRVLGKYGIKQVVYVSCNPATFSRDAKYMAQMGYKLKEVQPVDLFPQTSHVELVGNFLFSPYSSPHHT